MLLTSRQSSRAAKVKAEDAAARAARVPNRRGGRPLAGPRTLPAKRVGLYDPALEKDSCGVGLAVQMKSVASRQVRTLVSLCCFDFVRRTCTRVCVLLKSGCLFAGEREGSRQHFFQQWLGMLLLRLFAATYIREEEPTRHVI